jgi:hypothetical protein
LFNYNNQGQAICAPSEDAFLGNVPTQMMRGMQILLLSSNPTAAIVNKAPAVIQSSVSSSSPSGSPKKGIRGQPRIKDDDDNDNGGDNETKLPIKSSSSSSSKSSPIAKYSDKEVVAEFERQIAAVPSEARGNESYITRMTRLKIDPSVYIPILRSALIARGDNDLHHLSLRGVYQCYDIPQALLRDGVPPSSYFGENIDEFLPHGTSKVGGLPDLPSGFMIPQGAQFVCQINCRDITPYDLRAILPSSGLLSYFTYGSLLLIIRSLHFTLPLIYSPITITRWYVWYDICNNNRRGFSDVSYGWS